MFQYLILYSNQHTIHILTMVVHLFQNSYSIYGLFILCSGHKDACIRVISTIKTRIYGL